MTSDLSSALEVCFKRDALNKSMFTLLYFTLLTSQIFHKNVQKLISNRKCTFSYCICIFFA